MLLDDLISSLEAIRAESRGAHPGVPRQIDIWLEGPTDEDLCLDGEIIGVEPYLAPGCGCWLGGYIRVRVTPER